MEISVAALTATSGTPYTYGSTAEVLCKLFYDLLRPIAVLINKTDAY